MLYHTHLLIFENIANSVKKPFPNKTRRRPEEDPNKTFPGYRP